MELHSAKELKDNFSVFGDIWDIKDFYRNWKFDESSKIVLRNEKTNKNFFVGKAIEVPIIYEEMKIVNIDFTSDNYEIPILILRKGVECHDSIWKDWMDKKIS